MKIYPHNALDQLDYPRLKDEVSQYCAGGPARRSVLNLEPLTELYKIEKSLTDIRFFMHLADLELYLELYSYDLPSDLDRALNIEGYVLSRTAFLQVRNLLDNEHEVRTFLNKIVDNPEIELEVPFSALPDTRELRERLHDVMDETGEINPGASSALMSITRQIAKKQSEITTVFTRMARQYRDKGLLSDIEESYRNGRRVLALPAENKRRIDGVIHGESETGKTVFIEPQQVTQVNNELFQLHADKQKEEYRILKDLNAFMQGFSDNIRMTSSIISEIDCARAKSIYSRKRGFSIPRFDPEASIHLKEVYHPHLDTHLREEGKHVVKNDIILHGSNHILLLSGPNAGGKSVSLKTVAFAQIMFQSGLPVAADPASKFRIYEKVGLDMGDNQSMEDDLSTYSSHLNHMKAMLEFADESTMLLIDEFGTGTDPRVGGALAESILHQFVKRRAAGVITTHYSNLKSYAHKTKGIVNGSMSFDMKSLNPTFLIRIGKPGSSFAFEIAKRMGLPDAIIDHARKKAGSQVYEMEKLLSQLEHEKKVIATKTADLERQEKELHTLQKTYSELKHQLDIQRKRYKAERKEQLARLKAQNIKELEKMRSEYREVAEAEKLLSERLKKEKEQQLEKIDEARALNKEAHSLSGELLTIDDVEVGDYVRIRDTDSRGQVTDKKKKTARVAVGPLLMDVPYDSLVPSKTPLEINNTKSIQYERPDSSIPGKLDIRGLSYKEARSLLVQYFDDALVRHIQQLEILHGRGNGVLRKLVRQVAKEYKDIREVRHPEEEAGGEGVSLILF